MTLHHAKAENFTFYNCWNVLCEMKVVCTLKTKTKFELQAAYENLRQLLKTFFFFFFHVLLKFSLSELEWKKLHASPKLHDCKEKTLSLTRPITIKTNDRLALYSAFITHSLISLWWRSSGNPIWLNFFLLLPSEMKLFYDV